jgi:hypothetical protein
MQLLSCWSEQARSSAYDLSTTNAGPVASAQIFRGTRTASAPTGHREAVRDLSCEEGVLPRAATAAARRDVAGPGQ